jgi:pimeloyl-ACP methyl ester carboxylesterase
MAKDRQHLLFVPGLLCTPKLFASQMAHVGGQAEVSVGDVTGHSSLPDMAAAILRAAPARFALAGLSMGGYVAFEILRQAPERVSKLALLDTNARADRPEQAQQRRELVGLGEREGLEVVVQRLLPALIHKDRLADRPLVGVVTDMAEEVGVAAFRRQQEAIIGRPDNRPFLAEIRCPTVVVVGAEDAITPVKVAEEICAGIAGSRLEVIPNCGHLSTLERPETVNRVLERWLVA